MVIPEPHIVVDEVKPNRTNMVSYTDLLTYAVILPGQNMEAVLSHSSGSDGALSILERSQHKSAIVAQNGVNRKRQKNSSPGEADAKILAALCVHHQYEDRSCLNWCPIGSNELAKLADVATGL